MSVVVRSKIGQTRVQRYWPGRAPVWAADVEEEVEAKGPNEAVRAAFPFREDGFLVSAGDDARLRRLAESRRNREDAIARHREIRQAEIVSICEERKRAQEAASFEEEEDEVAIEARRCRIKEKMLEKQRDEEIAMEEDVDEDEEEEKEYEIDCEDEAGAMAMVKPLFVKKSERDTIIGEREKLEAEENAMQEALKRLEERKMESRQLVFEEITREKERKDCEANAGDVDTDDELNEAQEYEAWKAREIARIKRVRDDLEAMTREKQEIKKLRNMTEDERTEWERKNPKPQVAPKKKWKFMQKYYHPGAFFQTTPDDHAGTKDAYDILRRDTSAPTGDDKMDKTILPKVMQVKHFGRSGRTKWTHLVAEDTTQWDNPWTSNTTKKWVA